MNKIFTLLLLGSISASAVSAQRLRTEDFNYAPGQLTSANGGANVSGGLWVTNSGNGKFLQVVAGDLTYPDYITNPSLISAHLELDTSKSSSEDAYTSFDSVKTGTLYASFLLNVEYTERGLAAHDSANADYFVAFLPGTSTSAYTGRLAIRQGSVANTFNLGISAQSFKNTPISWIAIDYPINIIHLVTLGYQFVDGPLNDTAKLWVDAPFSATEPAPLAFSVYAAGSESQTGLARFAVRQDFDQAIRGGTPKALIDAIKISTSWADGTLPLQLRAFSVVDNNGFAKLTWETSNEINVKNFEIQRSADARSFVTIAEVAAKNATGATYSFGDAKALSGLAYYRIRIVDNDGAASYSGIVSVSGKLISKIGVFPNPVVNSLVLMHPKVESNATMQVVSLNGKPVLSRTIQSGTVQTSVDVSSLTRGTYIVIFTNGTDKQTLKFVKQ